MNIVEAKPDEQTELALFARATYEQVYVEDVELSVLKKHIDEKMSDEKFKQMMSVNRFYLAREERQIVGFVQVGPTNISYGEFVTGFDPEASELKRLYVLADKQSSGIGTALIETALQDPTILGTGRTYLTTWGENHGAQKLYRRHRFTKVGEIPEYSSTGALNGYEHIMMREN